MNEEDDDELLCEAVAQYEAYSSRGWYGEFLHIDKPNASRRTVQMLQWQHAVHFSRIHSQLLRCQRQHDAVVAYMSDRSL